MPKDNETARTSLLHAEVLRLENLLERSLKAITPNCPRWVTYKWLLEKHGDRIQNLDGIYEGRRTRHRIAHSKPVSPDEVQDALSNFETAIRQVAPKALQDEIESGRTQVPDPVEQEVPPTPEPPPVENPPSIHDVGAVPPSEVLARDTQSRSWIVWFVLAAVFFLISAIGITAYITQHNRPEPGVVLEKSPSPEVTARKVLPQTGAPPPQALQSPAPETKVEKFRELINTNLSVSSSQPNVGLLIESADAVGTASIAESVQGFLTDTRVRLIGNVANVSSLEAGGFFDRLYGGDGKLLSEAIQLSRVDYILLGKAQYSFRVQTQLDPDLVTAALTLSCRLVDRSGTVVQSATLSANGPGFNQSQALERAVETISHQLKDRLAVWIP